MRLSLTLPGWLLLFLLTAQCASAENTNATHGTNVTTANTTLSPPDKTTENDNTPSSMYPTHSPVGSTTMNATVTAGEEPYLPSQGSSTAATQSEKTHQPEITTTSTTSTSTASTTTANHSSSQALTSRRPDPTPGVYVTTKSSTTKSGSSSVRLGSVFLALGVMFSGVLCDL